MIAKLSLTYALRKKCPYTELFWSSFSRIWTDYGVIRSISLYSVRMRENADQYNSEYGHFLHSDGWLTYIKQMEKMSKTYSLRLELFYGVPQESIPELVLFNAFLYDFVLLFPRRLYNKYRQ